MTPDAPELAAYPAVSEFLSRQEHRYTGKVTALFFDRFGDFEAFDLRTEKGEEHSFRAFEHEIEELILRRGSNPR